MKTVYTELQKPWPKAIKVYNATMSVMLMLVLMSTDNMTYSKSSICITWGRNKCYETAATAALGSCVARAN